MHLRAFSRETRIAVIASLLFHVCALAFLALLRIQGASSNAPLLVAVEIPEEKPSAKVRRLRPSGRLAGRKDAPPRSAVPAEKPVVEARPREREEQFTTVTPLDTARSHSAPIVLRPRLTYAAAESLGKLFPNLKQHLLREAVVQRVLEDDSAYQVWHIRLAESVSPRDLPSEFEGTARTNQARFGVPYNPMRGPPAPNQIDLIALIRALRDLTRTSKGK